MSEKTEPKIHGPAIDGIEEYDNPLPRWWLFMFYISIVFSVVYWVLYPSWFGEGYLKWSQYKQYNEEIVVAKKLYPVKAIDIMNFINKAEHIEQGRQIFSQNCAACHGPEGKGLVGPNLTDNIWIHGGKPQDIQHTITHGVSAKGMPTWGPVLGNEKIAKVASFVYSFSHDLNGNLKKEALEAPVAVKVDAKMVDIAKLIGNPENIEKGRKIFQQNCTSCHGPEGKGLVGPNLTDNVWIHGGKPEEIQHTITNGVAAKGMPTWGPIIGAENVGNAAAFVYSLSHK